MKIIKWLYRIFLMPILERDRYFKEECEKWGKEADEIAAKIIRELYGK